MRVRVLLVDDSADVRNLLRTRIEIEQTFEVVDEAADGAEAIALATRHQPDVIVLDAMMPVLGGIEALPAILRHSPASKVIVYSAFTDDLALDRIYDAGAHAVMNKAAPLEQLFVAMSGLLPGDAD
ncbi:MAG: response regulator transcription factor [Actinomycetota bacterium]|nr:response regulator transcription factor [Actinomycetota bacterium]